MLSPEDNELVTRVGPGTLMGTLMREYWLPALLSSELQGPDSDPVRVVLLGEQLVAFRDTNGSVGLLAHACPHRGASLYFGRNEECGLRCVYHGWKFDVAGSCVDMPSEPPESNFKSKVKAGAYPCVERGGLVWAYMGPREVPPPLPDIEATMLPSDETRVFAVQRECNWLQSLEGDVDTVHVGFLHAGSRRVEQAKEGTFSYYSLRDRSPRYRVVDTDYGSMYGAYRPAGPGEIYWRIAQFLFPCWVQTPTGILGNRIASKAWVPMDDTHTMLFGVRSEAASEGRADQLSLLPDAPGFYGRHRYVLNAENDYQIDRERQRTNQSYTGIPGHRPGDLPFAEDQVVTESMGSVIDRSAEHLGTSDVMVIRVRQRLLEAAQTLADKGVVPPGVDDPAAYRVRSGGVILPEEVDWLEGIRDLLPAFVDHPELAGVKEFG
ncbi:MAG: Rieske 2Fe-2S domain-containing protein [Micrococcales bacterium]|nr:Rieske 2Fe-2S domain-containing protein [Micrococcales bacterium]